MGTEAPAIEVDDLVVRRGRTVVLDGLGFSVGSGDVVGLLGPSGCGKSTLLRSIVGTQLVHGGSVRVLGEPAGSRQLRRRVSYMTQSLSIYDDLTVRQNLEYFRKVLVAPGGDTDRVLELTDLAGSAHEVTENLSGGQRSRVSLAVALLGDPEVMILDEPTVGLDPVLRADLWSLFRQLAADGASLLISSHVMDEATRCDRLLLMREGRFIADDSPAGLLRSTGTGTTEEAFLTLIAANDPPATATPRTRGRHRRAPAGQAPGGNR
ncbi:MAG: ABC transporter ATP-binding protein [Micrococcaceae bacterium]|nr:ABC transporter ATP-binding protein [Micrococcaceae bacterium]MDN5823380.1 ABC transporter ATP-binding protein [Micrococcaceae bacterium]MDN6201042.1 ABC transporter ATP-binding protein [Micrococcaceae bacterium]